MRRVLAAASLATLLAAPGATPVAAGGAGVAPVVAAYYAGYDPQFDAAQIPGGRLTDVIYAFGAIDPEGRCALANPAQDAGSAAAGAPPGGVPAAAPPASCAGLASAQRPAGSIAPKA